MEHKSEVTVKAGASCFLPQQPNIMVKEDLEFFRVLFDFIGKLCRRGGGIR